MLMFYLVANPRAEKVKAKNEEERDGKHRSGGRLMLGKDN